MRVKTIGTTVRNLVGGFGLRGTLVRRMGVTGLILLIAVGVFNYNQVSSNMQQQAEQTARAQAAADAKQLDGVLQTIAARVYQMGTVAAMPGVDQPQLRVYLRDLLPQIPVAQAYDDYMFWDDQSYKSKDSQVQYLRDGWPNLYYDSYDYHDASQRWYVVPKQTGRTSFTEPFFDAGGTNQSMFSVTTPVKRDGKFIGVMGSDVKLALFAQITSGLHFNESGKPAMDSFALLATGQGNLVSYPDLKALASATSSGQTVRTVSGGRLAAVATAADGSHRR